MTYVIVLFNTFQVLSKTILVNWSININLFVLLLRLQKGVEQK